MLIIIRGKLVSSHSIRFYSGLILFVISYSLLYYFDPLSIRTNNKAKSKDEKESSNKVRGGSADLNVIMETAEKCLSEPGYYEVHNKNIKNLVRKLISHLGDPTRKRAPAFLDLSMFLACWVISEYKTQTNLNVPFLDQLNFDLLMHDKLLGDLGPVIYKYINIYGQ